MDTEQLPLCFIQMEQDLYAALETDTQRELENDAKFRAVSQKVSSYEEFREMVKAAHLKPLNRGHVTAKNSRGRIWNSIALKKSAIEEEAMETEPRPCECPTNVLPLQLPSSSSQFLCWWRRCDQPSRLSLLYKLGPAALGHLFRIDIPTDLLGEILQALYGFNSSVEDVIAVVALLEALTEVKRFSLGLQFLNSAEHTTCRQLMQKLMASLVHREQDLAEQGVTEWSLQQLAKKYKVHLQSA